MTRLMKTLMPSLLLLVLGFTSGASGQTCSGGCGCDNEKPANYCCPCVHYSCHCGCSICQPGYAYCGGPTCEGEHPPVVLCPPCKCLPSGVGGTECGKCATHPCEGPNCTYSTACPCGKADCGHTDPITFQWVKDCDDICSRALSTDCGATRPSVTEWNWQGGGETCTCGGGTACLGNNACPIHCINAVPPHVEPCGGAVICSTEVCFGFDECCCGSVCQWGWCDE